MHSLNDYILMLPQGAVDVRLRVVIHVEPALREATSHALSQTLHDKIYVRAVLRCLCSTTPDPHSIADEGTGSRSMTNSVRPLQLWHKALYA